MFFKISDAIRNDFDQFNRKWIFQKQEIVNEQGNDLRKTDLTTYKMALAINNFTCF